MTNTTTTAIGTPRALYIHIPFCTNKCFYCDFTSYVVKGQPVDRYLDALEQEMIMTVSQLPPQQIDTVFVGGGTPTVLTPVQMERFLTSVHRHFPLAKDVEFSMEANPGTTDLEKLKVMFDGGVNRLSFGVQSFDDKLLERIGRIHSVDDVYASIANARKAGFDNMSIDLMFGLPDQTLSQLADSVEKAVQLELPHYSLYSLKIEENTLFHHLYHRNKLPLPSEDDEFSMYMLLIDQLTKFGYSHYEISNFAKAGYESKHNSIYWRNEPYYGLGAGAHGYAKRTRHVNIKGVQPYIDAAANQLPRLETYTIDEKEAMEDFMMVGLRLMEGVRTSSFAAQFPNHQLETVFAPQLAKLLQTKLIEKIEQDDDVIYRLTKQGVIFGNDVFASFLE